MKIETIRLLMAWVKLMTQMMLYQSNVFPLYQLKELNQAAIDLFDALVEEAK